jgi:hypothetical protein
MKVFRFGMELIPKQITYGNMKSAALHHRSTYDLKSTDLAEILAHMCVHDDWDLNISIRKGGIPLCDVQWFEEMCKGTNDFLPILKTMCYGPEYNIPEIEK